jgi:hypothetical protein
MKLVLSAHDQHHYYLIFGSRKVMIIKTSIFFVCSSIMFAMYVLICSMCLMMMNRLAKVQADKLQEKLIRSTSGAGGSPALPPTAAPKMSRADSETLPPLAGATAAPVKQALSGAPSGTTLLSHASSGPAPPQLHLITGASSEHKLPLSHGVSVGGSGAGATSLEIKRSSSVVSDDSKAVTNTIPPLPIFQIADVAQMNALFNVHHPPILTHSAPHIILLTVLFSILFVLPLFIACSYFTRFGASLC